MIASILPALPAYSAPTISILNPSGYGPAEISIKSDAGNDYQFVAWVGETPATPSVQFALAGATFDAMAVNADTWEASYRGEVADGTHTLTARLFSNGVQVATAQRTVEVKGSSVPLLATEGADIGYPANGGPFGFYAAPGKPARAVIDATTSQGATNVRMLFSVSDPGTNPQWTQCGAGPVPASRQVRLGCTLPSGIPPGAVTAVAVTTNSTQSGSPNSAFDDSGDAHRVLPYVQDPAVLHVTPSSTSVSVGQCAVFVARVLDQNARPVRGANIDVHASGPDATLRFGSGAGSGEFQGPQSGHTSESGVACSGGSDAGSQGAHDAIKHIESTAGTGNSGEWGFALRSAAGGGAHVSLWVDEDDNDSQSLAEPAAGAQIGWGQEPPPPQREVLIDPVSRRAVRTTCTRLQVATRQGGAAAAFQNVDVHISGPSAGVSFCDPGGGSAAEPPDGGGHGTGGSHPDGARHIEGSSGLSGVFVFGVGSYTLGSTSVTVWIDETDDDVPSNEPSATSAVTWTPVPFRSISFEASRARITRGGKVRLFGALGGDDVCIARKTVKIEAKPLSGGSFRTIKKTTSGLVGKYGVRLEVSRSRKYRAVAPATGSCFKATSRTVAVRVRS